MEITTDVVNLFRSRQSAFFDISAWPTPSINEALVEADAETGGSGWGGYDSSDGSFKQRGMFLYAAHFLSANYPTGCSNAAKSNSTTRGIIQSKSVGDESVSFAVATPLNIGDTWLASTSYGQQFMRLRRRAGMGALAL